MTVSGTRKTEPRSASWKQVWFTEIKCSGFPQGHINHCTQTTSGTFKLITLRTNSLSGSVYRKSSAENMPLARRRIESLDASYGCSLDGISSTAGIDCMWASMAWRIISAMNWLIRMMPMSLRVKKLLHREKDNNTPESIYISLNLSQRRKPARTNILGMNPKKKFNFTKSLKLICWCFNVLLVY